MGIWAGIKHALNNTLGTSSFKPLNTIITDYISAKVTELTSHVTSKTKTITDLITSETSGVESHVTSKTKTITDLITSETSGVESHVTSKTKTITDLITSETSGVESLINTKTSDLSALVSTETENTKQTILNQIYNSKSLLASDEVFYVFPSAFEQYAGEKSYYTYEFDLCQFVMPLAGFANLLYRIGVTGGSSGKVYTEFSVIKNGTVCHSSTTYYTLSSSSNSDRTVQLDFVRGDEFKIRIKFYNTPHDHEYRPYVCLYSLNATIKDSETISLQTLV